MGYAETVSRMTYESELVAGHREEAEVLEAGSVLEAFSARYCGVEAQNDATLTTRMTLPRYSDQSSGLALCTSSIS